MVKKTKDSKRIKLSKDSCISRMKTFPKSSLDKLQKSLCLGCCLPAASLFLYNIHNTLLKNFSKRTYLKTFRDFLFLVRIPFELNSEFCWYSFLAEISIYNSRNLSLDICNIKSVRVLGSSAWR